MKENATLSRGRFRAEPPSLAVACLFMQAPHILRTIVFSNSCGQQQLHLTTAVPGRTYVLYWACFAVVLPS